MRAYAVIIHRYVGLVIAGFLLIAGLTGALLVWYHDLDAALNPSLLRVEPPRSQQDGMPVPLLDPMVLREKVQAAYPDAAVNYVSFYQGRPEDARPFYIQSKPNALGQAAEPAVDEVFVNPYTGKILGGRKSGDITQGITNLMPFLYRLHYSLALGTVGTWAFGIVAVLWTLDCFVGAWLTFPPRSRSHTRSHKSWLKRWLPAWKVRVRGGSYKLNYDLHRAGGLWPWALFLVLAWSSVAFNLHEPVYKPVMGVFFDLQSDPRESLPKLAKIEPDPVIGWPAALAIARQHMGNIAHSKGFTVLAEDRVSYDPNKGYLRYVVRTDLDISQTRGQSSLFIDGSTGNVIAIRLPTGQASGDTVTTWLSTLHMANIWGLPFKVFMTLLGMAVTMLSGTGLYIWVKKRRGRNRAFKLSAEKRHFILK